MLTAFCQDFPRDAIVWGSGTERRASSTPPSPATGLFCISYTTFVFEELMAGKYFEEFRVGDVFRHQPSRTVTETDNLLFTALTMNPQPLHLDVEFSRNTEFGQRLVNSIFTLGLVVGLSVGELTLGTTVGNLGFEKTEFPRPVFIGDTITAETEIIEVRESKSRPQWGVVMFEHRGVNQRGEIVVRARRAGMMRRKPA